MPQHTWAGFQGKAPQIQKVTEEALYSPDRLLVKLRNPRADAARFSATLKASGLRVERDMKVVPGLKILKSNGKAASKIEGLKRRMEALIATGLFEYVEPDFHVQVLQTPTDTSFTNGDLWGLQNTGQNGGVAGVDINTVSAWSISTGSFSVTVAVIDTGVRYTHQDLAGNMWINPGEIAANGIDDDGNGYVDDVHGINAITATGDPMDDHNHGTHVAGTIAATAFDSGRHVGVAYDARIMALKFLDNTGNGSISGAISCIDYAITKGATIMNNSWGGYGYSQALKDAVDAANAAGILFVAAAGNSGTDNDASPLYPASYDAENVISVAAIDRTGELAYFSNFGASMVDLAAPGVAILSSTASSDSSYEYFDGTSMATPHVAGVAALLASEYPTANITELRARLLQSTTPLSSLSGQVTTGGLVNAGGALLIAADGDMEFQPYTSNGSLIADEVNTIFVRLNDFLPVTGATVSGYLDGGSPAAFLDDGVAPDDIAGDAVYTGLLFAPGGAPTINLNLSATAPGKNPSAGSFSFNIITPPPNDDFANRIFLLNSETFTTGYNNQATLEIGESINPPGAGAHTVWWEWVPSSSGSLSVSTAGSSFDTTLAVYEGTSLENLVLLDADDDALGLQSGVTFDAEAGQSYFLQVNGYGNWTGSIRLNYGQFYVGPPNDDFADRIVLPSGTIQTVGSNVGATFETGEPNIYFSEGWETVWWEWIAPSSSPASINTFGSSFDTVLSVYQGTEVSGLTLVAWNDDAGGGSQSSVTFTPVPGQSYMIQVYGLYYVDPTTGSIVLNYPDPAAPAVPNDYFAQRILLEPGSTQTTGSNEGATLETDEPVNPGTAGGSSVWWEWISPLSGSVVINTSGSSFDTTLAAYTGDQINQLALVAADDDSSGLQSEVSFLAIQGISYKIQVNGASGDFGDIKLNYPEAAYPNPSNDDFEDRITLAMGTTQANGTTQGATVEAGEPVNPSGSGTRTVWWEWIAPSADPATITTVGSGFDTTLAVYSGTTLEDLVLLADDNDTSGEQSSITFTPVTGQPYQVQVNGFGTATGPVVLNYPLPGILRPANDNFDNRIILPPGSIRAHGRNDNATSEPNEPVNPIGAGSESVWWVWISPFTGPATIDTIDSTFDTAMAIYTGTELGSLTLVGANDDFVDVYSGVTFDAITGESYIIQVTGLESELDLSTGEIYLNYPMPFPVSVTPGSLRVAGVSGGSTTSTLTLLNGDSIPVAFSITSPDGWISATPASGTIDPGTELEIALSFSPLPSFSGATYASVDIAMDHPSLPSVQLPVEILDTSLVIDIPDPNLRTVVEQYLGRLPGEPIADIEMAILTTLDARNRGIASLVGLEHAVNLFYLYLDDNQISDLLPLTGLTSLFIVDLSNNNLSDISILLNAPILFDVDVRLNYLDISSGSDDRTVIDTLISQLATVQYDPQKEGLMSMTDWAIQWDIHPSNRKENDVNGPLDIPNILAFMMGLDPFSATGADMPVAYRIPGTNLYTFTYYRDSKAMGIITSHQKSYDLGTWETTTPLQIDVLWDDGNGHQQVEAIFEDPADQMFLMLEVISY
jgi:subtilisin family serine protease